MDRLSLISNSTDETQQIGRRLGELAQAGDLLLLVGELGTGKTCLTQGIALGLGIDDYITSPSFVLIREHKGRLPLYHIDLYRLDKAEEILDLGLDDYLSGPGVCVVEWADKALDFFPKEHLLITLNHLDETKRTLHLQAKGQRYEDILSQIDRISSMSNKA
ncbi:MAG: tRNA (adenosine(37)-N6)-threonylcarbamoyltransferase complex ATPase subunit type 1 TsaE [Chloroflexi bacterium RBG_13_54_9]|nr:MAG: tRNA (adenosine(37)-N6)-threonylcarbamoyltransferase complex ATPase subunit type 1 TsaE [Chloroflexi bacterium RBG_13_54_9]